MFMTPFHEEVFYANIEAYKSEFGAEKVVVVFPRSWSKRIELNKFKPMKVKSWDMSAVGIRIENGTAHWETPVVT